MSIVDSPNLNLKTFVDFSGGPERETWSGLPKRVEPTDHRLSWKFPWELPQHAEPRKAGLLSDPVPVRSAPTKPVAKPEPAISLYRSACHECGHALTCFAFDVPVARMSLIKDGDKLGHIKHADLPDSDKHLAILLGGRAAEIVTFGDERLAGSEGDMNNARAMAKRLAGDGAEKLIEKVLGKNIAMLRGEKNALRYVAYELVNKRQIDFEDVDAAIDWAFTRQANAIAKVAPHKTFDLFKKKDIAAFAQKFPDIMRTADGFIRPSQGKVTRR
jgi:Peptidase family M41